MAFISYYPENDRTPRKIAVMATVVYFLVLAAIIFLFSFRLNSSLDPLAGGMMIDFGNTETGSGNHDLPDAKIDRRTTAETAVLPRELLTQDIEDAPHRQTAVKPEKQKTVQPAEQPQKTVDRRALFPGQSDAVSPSEGENTGKGNQGRPDGIAGGNRMDGSGSGNGSFSLEGRKIVGSLPEPEYNADAQGRVIVEVRVNQQGQVTSAAFRSNGSTTTNHILVQAAERAAKKAVFNVDENAPFTQVGTITYNFRMQ